MIAYTGSATPDQARWLTRWRVSRRSSHRNSSALAVSMKGRIRSMATSRNSPCSAANNGDGGVATWWRQRTTPSLGPSPLQEDDRVDGGETA